MWITQPDLTPAARTSACSVCGGASHVKETGGALGTGVDIEWEGLIEVCVRCIEEAAALIGLVRPEKVDTFEEEYAELRAWADETYPELERRDAIISTLSTALATTVTERDELRGIVAYEANAAEIVG